MNICLREQNIFEKTPYTTENTCKFYHAPLQRHVYLAKFFMFRNQFAVSNTVLYELFYSYHNLKAPNTYFIPVSITCIFHTHKTSKLRRTIHRKRSECQMKLTTKLQHSQHVTCRAVSARTYTSNTSRAKQYVL